MVNELNDMKKLAINGHQTRGKEVIEILKMLGGSNPHNYNADCGSLCFYIGTSTNIIYYDWVNECYKDEDTLVFTLEEFLEKFPYKIGDKVNYIKYNDGNPSVYTIQKMRWTGMTVEYLLDLNGFTSLAKDLQPYKEEAMKGKGTLVEIDLTKELKVADEVEVILGDYEFVLKDGGTYFVKKKTKYPKTYEECCKVLLLNPEKSTYSVCGLEYKRHLIVCFQRLLICRDAYWKIAGNWKPEYKEGVNNNYYTIHTFNNKITLSATSHRNAILAFPTEEMRDAFYENFKELIEECKELL